MSRIYSAVYAALILLVLAAIFWFLFLPDVRDWYKSLSSHDHYKQGRTDYLRAIDDPSASPRQLLNRWESVPPRALRADATLDYPGGYHY